MAQYDVFAEFYDAVNGEPHDRVSQILSYIRELRPSATSIVELGCGTGAILAGLGSGWDLTGVDISEAMLTHARRRVPQARLVLGDIASVQLGSRFDVAVCVYDTLNHLTTFEQWENVFSNVAEHLVDGGLFIFDLNTMGRCRDLGDMAPWVHDFDAHTLIMDVDFDEPYSRWDIRIFERRSDTSFRLHHEIIVELAVPLDTVREALSSRFDIAAESDTLGATPTDASARALFVARRHSR